jgi:thioredoxin 1
LRPVVDGLKPEYGDRVEFEELDLYENRDVADKYDVLGHPTLVFLRADASLSSVIPGVPKEKEIRKALDQALR